MEKEIDSRPSRLTRKSFHNHDAAPDQHPDHGRYAPDHRRHPDNYPQLIRHEEPTLLEIFYDLFFAAAYNAFCSVQEVNGRATLKSSIGFFCLLWLTWFNVTLFDVRYATDSIFSRLNTAIQLGVLVGYVVAAPKFNSTVQHAPTMRAMSIILAVSRFNLVGQYAWITMHVRRFRATRLPLLIQIGIYAVAGVIYLGLTFCFQTGYRSHAFVAWYCLSGAESVASLLLSTLSPMVSLGKTHLLRRLTLLTVMILGEGVQSIAQKMIVIIKNPGAWDALTIGYVTAACATIYFVFLVYFDWLGTTYLPPLRRNLWITLHLPFHLALVLFSQGFTQLLLWGKIVNQVLRLEDYFFNPRMYVNSTSTSQSVKQVLTKQVSEFFENYPSKFDSTNKVVEESLSNLTSVPDSFWPQLMAVDAGADVEDVSQGKFNEISKQVINAIEDLITAMTNEIFSAFGTSVGGEVQAKNKGLEKSDNRGFQLVVLEKNWKRYGIELVYTYIGVACTMTFILLIKQLRDGYVYRGWNLARQLIILGLALGTGLATTVWFYDESFELWLQSPWVLPPLTFVWLVVVILAHIDFDSAKPADEARK